MKKNITINLCGRLYQIDEDAYEMLQQYIESLRSYFGRQEGGDEIVDDIEARVAELLDELKLKGINAITIDHVKEIITRIGKPEQMAGDNEDAEENENTGHRYSSAHSAAQDIMDNLRTRTAGKKLYRNPKDKMVAGVLSGFATYTNTDPVIWRLLTLLLFCFYGVGLLGYIMLAIVLPEAKTPEQLLQMEGKQVNPQNLADMMVEKNEPSTERPSLLRSLFSLLLKVLFGFFVGIAVIVGIILGLGFLFALVVLVSALAFPVSSNMPFSLETMGLAELYHSNPIVLILFTLSLFMLLLIPIYAIIHLVLSLSNKVQPMGIAQRIVWVMLWIAALCCVVPCSITMAEYSEDHQERKYHERYNTYYQGVEMSVQDADFLRKGGWQLLKAENCAHYTYSGQYYDGNGSVRYLDTYNDACEEIFQAERKETVKPGIYQLSCIARAEGPGPCIYAIGDAKQLKSIPAYGNKGGELVGMLQQKKAEIQGGDSVDTKLVSTTKTTVTIMGIDFVINESTSRQTKRQKQQQEEGRGWSIVSIDNIVVAGDTIAYGVSTDEAFTGQSCHAKWFSATDFKLTRTGDLPVSKGKKL